MSFEPNKTDYYEYFRMGLVCGLVEPQAVIEWADQRLMQDESPDPQVIDLSLCASQSLSQIVWLLNQLTPKPAYTHSLPMLFARAGEALRQNPARLAGLILGLRLLKAEEWLPKDLRSRLTLLEDRLEDQRQGRISTADLETDLKDFLESSAA
jgi:hypothetical protein